MPEKWASWLEGADEMLTIGRKLDLCCGTEDGVADVQSWPNRWNSRILWAGQGPKD